MSPRAPLPAPPGLQEAYFSLLRSTIHQPFLPMSDCGMLIERLTYRRKEHIMSKKKQRKVVPRLPVGVVQKLLPSPASGRHPDHKKDFRRQPKHRKPPQGE